MASADSPMPPRALAAFRKAAELDPQDPRARYFLAVNRDIGGDHQGAIDDWLVLLAETPPGAPWEAELKRTIEQVGKVNGITVAPRIAAALARRPALEANSGPSREQLEDAVTANPSREAEPEQAASQPGNPR